LGPEASAYFEPDCNATPGQSDYPECLNYWLEPVQGEEHICPPTHLWLWITGWPAITDGYRVRLRDGSSGGLTELVLEGEPQGTPGPLGPAPGKSGDVLAEVQVSGGQFTAFRASSVLRRYHEGVFLRRTAE
jgi:hypothetical protein